MERARARVQELGGLEATNSYTRFYLALVGAVGWDMVPAVPPELMLLPNWFAINIYEMSSWTRGIVIPLAILYAHKPRFAVAGACSASMSCSAIPRARLPRFDLGQATFFSWRNFFLALDRGLSSTSACPGSRCGSARCARRRSGCSSTWNAARVGAPFIRP